jgi:hypothetical protein
MSLPLSLLKENKIFSSYFQFSNFCRKRQENMEVAGGEGV